MKLPKKISCTDGIVKAQYAFREIAIPVADINEITLDRVPSLVDEIGVWLIADPQIFFTDAIDGFQEIAVALDFDAKFGKNWYSQAENGKRLSYQC